jgi:NAD(P)-dependent dehydrogenase (short-subunit alcohol dehydrogenase family)
MAVVLITGCSSGFGMLSAVAFAKRGDRVFATMRNVEKARLLREAAAAAGVEVEVLQLDVQDDVSVRRAVDDVIAKGGRIDIAVNNAGIGVVAAVEDFDDDELLKVFDTNVFGAIRVTRAVLPHMRRQRAGRLVHVGSMSGVVPSQFRAIYSATKAALAAMSDALAIELSPWAVSSSVVEPGFFQTAIGENRMKTRRQGTSDYAPLLEQYETGSAPKGSERVASDPVVDVILQAATDDPPRRHYIVGKDAEALSALKAKLPDHEFAQIIKRTMPALGDGA